MNTADFALRMYRDIQDNSGATDDIFFSPLSLAAAMAIVNVGAVGETGDEIASVLGIPNTREGHNEYGDLILDLNEDAAINVSNSVWVNSDYELDPRYTSYVQENYGAEAENVDVSNPAQVKATIDGWIREATTDSDGNALIDDVVDESNINSDWLAAIVNAVLLEAKWEDMFDRSLTAERDFALADGTVVQARMMTFHWKTKPEIRYEQDQYDGPSWDPSSVQTDGWKSICLPFADSDFDMIFILPRNNATLTDVMSGLTVTDVDKMANAYPREVAQVLLPKWRVESEYAMIENFQRLGVDRAFGPGAEFSRMIQTESPYIGSIIHKGFALVNEEGAKMAAATVIDMLMECAAGPTFTFVADQEVAYIVRHRTTGEIAFMGRVSSPHLSDWTDEDEEHGWGESDDSSEAVVVDAVEWCGTSIDDDGEEYNEVLITSAPATESTAPSDPWGDF